MDNKQLTALLAERTGLQSASAAAMLSELTEIIGTNCAELNSIAIPGFGTFSATKTDEYIATTPEGNRTLMPPTISVSFNPSIILRKKL